MKSLVFVTQNQHKVETAKKLLRRYQIEHVDFEVPEIQSLDPREIARYKLRFAFGKIQKPCFVMDTSLMLDCLNGFPGPFIKWYFEKTVGAEKTCEIAKHFNQFGCSYTSLLGYYDGEQETYFQETNNGTVPPEPRGRNGFHWDVIFIPEGESRTYAEMSFEEKHQHAVGAKLLSQLEEYLEN